MTIFKCKMCEGSLEITNETVAVCEYCRTVQTIPRLTDEKRVNLYDRANHFRRNNEYDKALSIYEQILLEDKTDAEAYWSILLCIYGIEYVEDPATHRRIPTVNRVQLTSILDDENYKATLKYSDSKQKKVYEQEAREINRIQKEILEISENEEPYDVFICYKETDANGERTEDSVLAQDIYTQLEQEGIRVFFSKISLEDKLGSAYEPYIFAAINSAKVMIVVGTKQEHFNAVWVKNEWSRYLAHVKNGENKTIIPAYKDMSPYDLPVEFSHLQSQDMSKIGFMQDLVRGVKKLLSEDKSVNSKKVALDDINLKIQKQNKRNKITIILAVAIFITAVIFVWLGQPIIKYAQGCIMMKKGQYDQAVAAFKESDFLDSFDKAKDALYYSQKKEIKEAYVGGYVNYGIYEQDGNESTKLEEITWLVLEIRNGKALLVSESILDYKQMHSESVEITWKDTDLRNWLNGEFYNSAFGKLHQKDIVETETECVDKVFILDSSKSKSAIVLRDCASTKYASGKSIYTLYTWTSSNSKAQSDCFAYIYKNNVCEYSELSVQFEFGVRPAIWVAIE